MCLGIIDRCAEIAFSGHQNAENQYNETLEKYYRSGDFFKIGFRQVCTFARFLYSLWQGKALQFKHITLRL